MSRPTLIAKTYGPLPGLVDELARQFDEPEWYKSAESPGLWWHPSARHARHLVFVTKATFFAKCARQDPRARDVSFVVKPLLPAVSELRWLFREADGRTIRFVGDLDPLDLTLYCCLQHAASKMWGSVTYAGVGGTWFDRVQANYVVPVSQPLIEMTAFEKAHWQLLKEQTPIEHVVNRGAAILDRGFKLEMEGSLAKASFRTEHRAELVSLVLDP